MIPTPIPEGGWKDEDIGREVIVMLPQGTLIPDMIIAIPHEGMQLIGPANEIGMIVARLGMIIPVVQAQDDFIMRYDNDDEGDDTQ